MIAVVAIVSLALVAGLALLLAAYLYREAGRREEKLLDRLQAPQAAQMAAIQRAVDERPSIPSDEEADARYGQDIRPRDDLAILDVIGA